MSKANGKARSNGKRLPPRSKVKVQDTWDLGSLFPSDAEWETAFEAWSKQVGGFAKFRGKLGESAKKRRLEQQLPPAQRRRSEIRHDQERPRREGRAGALVLFRDAPLAEPHRPQDGVSSVLRAVRRPQEHHRRRAARVGAAGRL